MDRLAPTSSSSPSLVGRVACLTFVSVLASITVPLASLVDTALLGHPEDLRFLAVRREDHHLLWPSLVLFMLARALTLWRATPRMFLPLG